MDKVNVLEEKVANMTTSMVTEELVKVWISEAMKRPDTNRVTTTTSSYKSISQVDDKCSRTVVFGGFPRDSEKQEIVKFIEANIIKETDSRVDEMFAYRLGSVGFVRFDTQQHDGVPEVIQYETQTNTQYETNLGDSFQKPSRTKER